MKKYAIAISALLMVLVTSCGTSASTDTACATGDAACCKAAQEEISGIRRALDLYVGASVKGDSRIAQPAFAATATISHSENGRLVSAPISELFAFYDSGAMPASYEISDCNVAGDVAVVRIESTFGETRYADMFSLVKDGTEWKIISKVFHVKGDDEK